MPSETFARPSCTDDRDPESLSVNEARHRILSEVTPVATAQRVALREALGRTLAESLISPLTFRRTPTPPWMASPCVARTLPADGSAELALAGEALAGHPFAGAVAAGQCIRIMTGAPMPAGTDTVVMQEQAQEREGRIASTSRHRPGQNVRQAGEDIATGDAVLRAGADPDPADLGLLASLGDRGGACAPPPSGRLLLHG